MAEQPKPSPDFIAAFLAQANRDGAMTFDRFMELALYDPELGYYRPKRARIGYGGDTDFFTASTSGPVFGELVVAACVSLLGNADARSCTFVEIGAENPDGVLAGVIHPFTQIRTIRFGEPIAISGQCVVFSNELFDAQPFRRFVFRNQHWFELGVAFRDGSLIESEIAGEAPSGFPATAPGGYVIDASLAATSLAKRIADQPWTGLFVACDYGKSWRELTEACPAGTARAYYRHQQTNDLLARPGEQDLTCHVCWDWLADTLSQHGFVSPTVESQEAFFIRHSTKFIAETSAAEAARFSKKKLSLFQLLHPSHLGQKFQVLHALRA